MDELKKKREEKVFKILDKVSEDFSEGLNRIELDKLYKRKSDLEKAVNDTERTPLNRTISDQQLKDVNESIDKLLEKVDINRQIDLEVDEEAAKKFIKENPDVFEVEHDFDYEDSDGF